MRTTTINEAPPQVRAFYAGQEALIQSVELYGYSVCIVESDAWEDRWELSGPDPNPSSWTWKRERRACVTAELYARAALVAEELKVEVIRRLRLADRGRNRFTGDVRYPGLEYRNNIGMFGSWDSLWKHNGEAAWCSVLSSMPMDESFPLFRRAFAPLRVPLNHPIIQFEQGYFHNLAGDERRPIAAETILATGQCAFLRPAPAKDDDVFTAVKIALGEGGMLEMQADPLYALRSNAREEYLLDAQGAAKNLRPRIYAWVGFADGGCHSDLGLPFAELISAAADRVVIGVYEGYELFVPERIH